MKKSNTFFRSELPAAVLLQTNLFFTASAFSFPCPLLSGVRLMPANASPLKLTAMGKTSASRFGLPGLAAGPLKPAQQFRKLLIRELPTLKKPASLERIFWHEPSTTIEMSWLHVTSRQKTINGSKSCFFTHSINRQG